MIKIYVARYLLLNYRSRNIIEYFPFIYSPIYLLVNIALITFVYTTWTERIWPAIRVPEADPGPEPEWTPVSPDVLSAPELVQLWEDFHSKICHGLTWLKNLRSIF